MRDFKKRLLSVASAFAIAVTTMPTVSLSLFASADDSSKSTYWAFDQSTLACNAVAKDGGTVGYKTEAKDDGNTYTFANGQGTAYAIPFTVPELNDGDTVTVSVYGLGNASDNTWACIWDSADGVGQGSSHEICDGQDIYNSDWGALGSYFKTFELTKSNFANGAGTYYAGVQGGDYFNLLKIEVTLPNGSEESSTTEESSSQGEVTANYEVVGPYKAGTVTKSGSTLTAKSASTRDYKFVAWYSDAECTNQLSTDSTYTPSSDAKVYAKFDYVAYNMPIIDVVTYKNGQAMSGMSSAFPDGCSKSTSFKNSDITIANADGYTLPDGINKVTIKGRGNSTWGLSKKPFLLQFVTGVNLFNNGKAANKKWILLANYADRTLLRNQLTFDWARTALDNIPFTTSTKPVEFYLNGEYQGVYLVVEQSEVANGRVTATKTTEETSDITKIGFFAEWDDLAENNGTPQEDYYVKVNNPSQYFTLKSGVYTPDDKKDAAGDPTDTTTSGAVNTNTTANTIGDYLNTVSNAIMSGKQSDIEKYVDVNSLVDMFILQEFTKNCDVGGSSFYVSKDQGADAKLVFNPPWDFDRGFGNDQRGKNADGLYVNGSDDGENSNQNEWFVELYRQDWFKSLVKTRWGQLRNNAATDPKTTTLSEINTFVANNSQSVERNFDKRNPSSDQQFYGDIGGTLGANFTEQVATLKSWITKRVAFMDSEFNYSAPPAGTQLLTLNASDYSDTYEDNGTNKVIPFAVNNTTNDIKIKVPVQNAGDNTWANVFGPSGANITWSSSNSNGDESASGVTKTFDAVQKYYNKVSGEVTVTIPAGAPTGTYYVGVTNGDVNEITATFTNKGDVTAVSGGQDSSSNTDSSSSTADSSSNTDSSSQTEEPTELLSEAFEGTDDQNWDMQWKDLIFNAPKDGKYKITVVAQSGNADSWFSVKGPDGSEIFEGGKWCDGNYNNVTKTVEIDLEAGSNTFSLVGNNKFKYCSFKVELVQAYSSVKFNVSVEGRVTADKTGPVSAGKKVTFSANPEDGKIVDKWIVNGTEKAATGDTLTMAIYDDTKVSATYKSKTDNNNTITIPAVVGGVVYRGEDLVSGGGPDGINSAKANETLTAKCRGGYDFVGWNIDGTTISADNSNLTLDLTKFDSASTVTPIFKIKPHMLMLEAEDYVDMVSEDPNLYQNTTDYGLTPWVINWDLTPKSDNQPDVDDRRKQVKFSGNNDTNQAVDLHGPSKATAVPFTLPEGNNEMQLYVGYNYGQMLDYKRSNDSDDTSGMWINIYVPKKDSNGNAIPNAEATFNAIVATSQWGGDPNDTLQAPVNGFAKEDFYVAFAHLDNNDIQETALQLPANIGLGDDAKFYVSVATDADIYNWKQKTILGNGDKYDDWSINADHDNAYFDYIMIKQQDEEGDKEAIFTCQFVFGDIFANTLSTQSVSKTVVYKPSNGVPTPYYAPEVPRYLDVQGYNFRSIRLLSTNKTIHQNNNVVTISDVNSALNGVTNMQEACNVIQDYTFEAGSKVVFYVEHDPVNTPYTVNVTGGKLYSLGSGTKSNPAVPSDFKYELFTNTLVRYDEVAVKAPKTITKEGSTKTFKYWLLNGMIYSYNPEFVYIVWSDSQFEAVYDDNSTELVKNTPVAFINSDVRAIGFEKYPNDKNQHKITFFCEFAPDVEGKCTITERGMIYAGNTGLASLAKLTSGESGFAVPSGCAKSVVHTGQDDKTLDGSSTNNMVDNQVMMSLYKSSLGVSRYARAYIVYKDANGVQKVAYSDSIAYIKNTGRSTQESGAKLASEFLK